MFCPVLTARRRTAERLSFGRSSAGLGVACKPLDDDGADQARFDTPPVVGVVHIVPSCTKPRPGYEVAEVTSRSLLMSTSGQRGNSAGGNTKG
jgi:hypothetical protein